MKNKEFYKLLKKNKSNSGFTLIELLVGVIMSTFVIGALGFGLMTMLRVTTKGDSETAARNETSRALDFISDEMRRAESIQVNKTAAIAGFTRLKTSGGANIDPSLILNVPGVTNPIVYSVAPPQTDTWKGPLVIYRWGPELNGDGSYSTSTFSSEPLVDKVSDTTQNATCDGSSVSYQGFFACVVDDDGDSTASEPEDSDGKAITAQLYFTGGTTAADGSASTYSADTKAVARARTAPGNNSEDLDSYTMSFRSLNPRFSCNINGEVNWEMRTDFGESSGAPGSLANWNHDESKPRQPQPIKITGNKLVISSIPRGIDPTQQCLNSRDGNGHNSGDTVSRDYSGNKGLGEKTPWKDKDDVVAVQHSIDFGDPTTFNGDVKDTCDANNACGGSVKVNDGDTNNLNTSILMLKRGSIIPDHGGYDANKDGDTDDPGEQQSLGEFLVEQKLAENTGTEDSPIYKIISKQVDGEPTILGADERIVAFEIGYAVSTAQTTPSDDASPGIDFQDNIFIVQSNKFKDQKFDAYTVN